MARFTTITGEQTDNLQARPARYRVAIRRPTDGAHLGLGTVTAECTLHRTGEITHAMVARDGRAVGACIPMAWLTRLPAGLPSIPQASWTRAAPPAARTATIIPFARRPTHA